jgi:hypothetical protein
MDMHMHASAVPPYRQFFYRGHRLTQPETQQAVTAQTGEEAPAPQTCSTTVVIRQVFPETWFWMNFRGEQ